MLHETESVRISSKWNGAEDEETKNQIKGVQVWDLDLLDSTVCGTLIICCRMRSLRLQNIKYLANKTQQITCYRNFAISNKSR